MDSNLFRKPLFSHNLFILIAALILLLAACFLNLQNKKPVLVLSKQDTAINVSNKFLTVLSAGHKRLITDLLWIQTLIESDVEHYKLKDLNNWMFLRFNTISILDPKFYENYLYGGQFLGIIKDDLVGAKILYEKGLEQYSDDYQLNFQAGFFYFFEIGDFKNGLKYLSKVENHPKAPYFLKSITNKLRYHIDGDLEKVFELVLINFNNTKDPVFRKRLKDDLYNIRAEIDLSCLNSQKKNCNISDLEGNRYIKDGNNYKPIKPLVPFQIYTK